MLGHRLWVELSPSHETYATVRSAEALANLRGLSRLPAVEGIHVNMPGHIGMALDEVRPDVVLNAVGLVKQLGYDDPRPMIETNALYPHELAQACLDRGIYLIHYSTDCVFDGRRGDYSEKDTPNPIDHYGRTKLLGEPILPNCLVVRTSFIGRELRGYTGLMEWFRNTGETAKGWSRAIWSGLTTHELARVTNDYLLDATLSGVYHIGGDPIVKYDLLLMLNEYLELGKDLEEVEGQAIDRSLDSSLFQQLTGYEPPSWPEQIIRMGKDLGKYRS